jgi:hypothetical protein
MDPLPKENTTPFLGLVLNTETPEQLEQKASEYKKSAEALRRKQIEAEKLKFERDQEAERSRLQLEKDADMNRLETYQTEYRAGQEILKNAHKLDLEKALELQKHQEQFEKLIAGIEKKYGINQITEQDQITHKEKSSSIWPTVSGIVALLFVCWGSVVYSGNWILDRYPGAAIYNAVSFQKVIFGFSVFIAEVAGAIIAISIFFPGIGKYFNPFNRDQLDFFTDFKQLSQWQRTLISLLLFFALLLAFVLTVSGKLD